MVSIYEPTETELLLCDMYQSCGIEYAYELDIDLIANMWGAEICYYPGRPYTEWDDDGAVILLTANGCQKENRTAFFHELCHIVQHEGRQDDLPTMFVELQEIQATQFQLVAATPYYMLPPPTLTWREYTGIISDKFSVTTDLAVRRVNHIISRLPAPLKFKLYIK